MVEITDGIFVETEYEGVNVAAIITGEGIICIDAPSYPRDARDWVVRIERLHNRPIRYVILTDGNGDRLLNIRWLNAPIVAHQDVAEMLKGFDKRYPQSLIESLNKRNPQQAKDFTNGPVEKASLSFSKNMSILSSRNGISLSHHPGPTRGSIWVEVPEKRLLFTGDSIVNDTQPYLKELEWQDWIHSLETLNDRHGQYDILVPGRGEVADLSVVASMIEYLDRMKFLVLNHVNEGRARDELNHLAYQLLTEYPKETPLEEWGLCQATTGLKRVYDQMFSENIAEKDGMDPTT
jgi:glyoxylase-like metal-dependent hydrolase (beta-lactamase superfamily II)